MFRDVVIFTFCSWRDTVMDKSFESIFQLYVRIESSYFAYIDKFYGNKCFLYLFHRFIEICETHLFTIPNFWSKNDK